MMGNNIESNLEICSSLYPSDENQFRLVNVTLIVRDSNGLPIRGAQVKAFSEDWGFRVPNFLFNETDEYGRLTLSLPVGVWSFFAWGGWDFINRNPGQGYFVVLKSVAISSDVSLTLQPDSYISIRYLGLDGRSLDGEVRILDSGHVPILPAPIAGRADSMGRINLKVKSGTLYDILFSWQNSTHAYIFLLEKIEGGSNLIVQSLRSSLAHITFKVFDRNNMPWNAVFFVNYDRFSIGENTGLNPIGIHVNGRLDLYTTPTLVTISPWIVSDPWCYVFLVQDYDLKAGENYEINLGGPLSIKVWTQQEQTQIWISILDSYGNLMDRFWNNGLSTRIPIILTKNGGRIFEGALDSLYDYLGVSYGTADSPDYTIDLDMGPYGKYTLTGTLLSESMLLPTKVIHTEHLDVEVPDVGGQVEKKFNVMIRLMEEIYQAISSALEMTLSSRTRIIFSRIHLFGPAGWAGTNIAAIGFSFSLDSSYVTIPSTFIGVTSHELGHVFQLSPPLCPPGLFIEWWFGEPYATLIGNVAIEKIFGESLALFDRGCHDHFYYYLKTGKMNIIENIQFALYYIKSRYGLSAFKKFNKIWTEETEKINMLQNKGLTLNETLVAALSLACGDDLSWLFSFIGLKIREDMASWGLALLSDYNSPISSINFDGLVGEGGWFISNVTVTLSAEDDLSGVDTILYSFDGVVWRNYVEPFTISNDGQFTIYFRAVDKAGNMEDIKAETIKVDRTPPSTTAGYDGRWYNTDFTITLTATDGGSGIKDIYYRINAGPIMAVSVDGHPIITTENANNTLEYWSVDAAGNEEPHKILTGIKLDKTAPVIREISRQPEGDIEPGQPVKVLVNATDSLSGVRDIVLSYNVGDSSVWIDVPMALNTTSRFYEGIIPGQQANVIVKYKIIIYDSAGNFVIGDNAGQYYTYNVIPEYPSTIILLAFITLITAATILSWRRKTPGKVDQNLKLSINKQVS
ncbi:MAG: Ig-like domain repeat protein [Candidatus Bathyarchaeia archaeon]